MCRILWARAKRPFQIATHLEQFATLSWNSPEYQGHGWGCAWLDGGEWRIHHNIQPVWEADLSPFGSTTLLLAHARSAFRDEGIQVENNMVLIIHQVMTIVFLFVLWVAHIIGAVGQLTIILLI